MHSDLLKSVRAEIDALERDLLARAPAFRKLKKLYEVLELFGLERSSTPGADSPRNEDSDSRNVATLAESKVRQSSPASSREAPSPTSTGVRKPSELRLKAEKLSEEYLDGRAEPTPTREILAHLVAEGLEIGGKVPASNLSAILSKSNRFQAVGRSGWILRTGHSHTASFPEEGEWEGVANEAKTDSDLSEML